MLETRTLARPDISEVVEGWNRSLVYGSVTQERFEHVMQITGLTRKGVNWVPLACLQRSEATASAPVCFWNRCSE